MGNDPKGGTQNNLNPEYLTYVETQWQDGITPLNSINLNNIEEGLINTVSSIKWLLNNQLRYEDDLILDCNNNWFTASSTPSVNPNEPDEPDEPQGPVEKAGLYDLNDNLVASYATLTQTYGLNLEKDYTEENVTTTTSSLSYILSNTPELSGGSVFYISSTVKKLGNFACARCTNLRSVVIPSNITTIGGGAFDNCGSLSKVAFHCSINSLSSRLFAGCSSLRYIELPDTVEQVFPQAFSDCTALQYVRLPQKLHTIGSEAFANCTSLQNITIPSNVKLIAGDVFKGCTSLTAINFEGSCTDWDKLSNNTWVLQAENAIVYCANGHKTSANNTLPYPDAASSLNFTLNEDNSSYSVSKGTFTTGPYVMIPSSYNNKPVTRIADRGFSGMMNLNYIAIPNTVQKIGEQAFSHCSNLVNIHLPDSVSEIGRSAFHTCSKLVTIDIPKSLRLLGGLVFRECNALTSVVIPSSVEAIGSNAFNMCNQLSSIVISDSVRTIDSFALTQCASLSKIYYIGLHAQWRNIQLNNNWKDSKSIVLTCVDGEVSV